MYNDKRILAVIPARGGSKGIAHKNIKLCNGKPLIAWTIESAKSSQYIDRLILSSESQEIIDVARQYDCEVPFVRPVELAKDGTPGIDPLLHAVESVDDDYDYVVLLQCTSPLRKSVHIDEAIQQCIETDATSCISVMRAKTNPQLLKVLNEEKQLEALTQTHEEFAPRQAWDRLYALNGAIYAIKCETLRKTSRLIHEDTQGYVMNEADSIDIDSQFDFDIAEFLMTHR